MSASKEKRKEYNDNFMRKIRLAREGLKDPRLPAEVELNDLLHFHPAVPA